MMIVPDFSDFKRLARNGNVVAVFKTVPADLETPVSSFLKLAGKLPNAFLLESAEQGEKVGRYSFIGLKPRMILTARHGVVSLTEDGKKVPVPSNELPVEAIQKILSTYQLANPETLPNFCGGFVGYLGYENVENFETIRLAPRKGPPIPDGIFFLTENFVIFDHFRKTLSVVVLVKIPSREKMKGVYSAAIRWIESQTKKLRQPLRLKENKKIQASRLQPVAHMTKNVFREKINKIKSYIRAGDCIQVVFSQRFTIPKVAHDFQIYRALRSINPSPYMFYFRAGSFRLIGSSPELLVKKSGREAEVRPIAGTRPRGKTQAEDLAFEENLRRSPKEMAEHLMLVDLGRNDLGRVCLFDSVRVKNFARVERYSHVMHLVSDVAGRLKPGKTAFDLLKATFPAGTVSGAPKIRAMQIINELEEEKRGPYAGCLGYFSFNHDMDMCILIRTLVLDSKKIYLQAGAGIVKDSNPDREYQETVNKARALLKAIEMQGDF